MTDGSALEKALRELVRGAVEEALSPLRQQLQSGVPSVSTVATSAASVLPIVKQTVSRIVEPAGQAEILGALLEGAKAFAGRCALFVRRGDSYGFWRGEGFPSEVIHRLRFVAVAANEPGVFREITESQTGASTRRSPESLTPALEQALGETVEETVYLFPIVVQMKPVAALYADAGNKANSVEPAALEILTTVSGLSLETSSARASGASARQSAVSEAGPSPESIGVAEAPAESPAGGVTEGPAGAAPFGSFAASIPIPGDAVAATPPPPDVDSLPEADRDIHRRAHRFARVAVQDLLSYHKNKIEEGRRSKNLYAVLREDIEKTRENYQKRFGETAASSFDYFHYELVVKLADNDPAALGQQYPGPVGS
ncbi:MAG: hypothetical protein HY648_06260 [Acidobacteria bacterium]|nr:hypothetical protein [Acidobacteriota bacterium]